MITLSSYGFFYRQALEELQSLQYYTDRGEVAQKKLGGITDCRNGIFLINVLSEFRLLLFFSKLCQPAERFHIEFGKLLGQKIKSDLGYLDDHGDKHDFNMYLSPPSENSTSSFWNSFEALKLLMPSTLTFSIASFSLLAQLAFRSFSSFSRSSILDNTSEYLLLTC